MNTGLQDAYNLAWKLALVIQGKAKEELLDSYQDERLPVARKLVRTTDRVFGITVSQNPLIALGRVYMMPPIVALLPKEKHIARLAFRLISQIGISYRDRSLSCEASYGRFSLTAPHPGDRLPFVLFQESNKSVNIQDKVKTPNLHLLLFSGISSIEAPEIDAIRSVANHWDIRTEILPLETRTRGLYKAFGIRNKGFYLVRPDMYIACRSSKLGAEHFQNYLARIFRKETHSVNAINTFSHQLIHRKCSTSSFF
jgi:FAD binding domain